MAANDPLYRFRDGDAYDRYMGIWSRAACPGFLQWLAASAGAKWLDVGCGTGVLTEAILATQSPAAIDAIDPSAAQLGTARQRHPASNVRFDVADACALPFADEAFDVVASALVVNFISDRTKAAAEMHRVLRPRGLVGAFVWDFAVDLSPSGLVRRALTRMGVPVPSTPGTEDSQLAALQRLFEAAGFKLVETRSFDVALDFE